MSTQVLADIPAPGTNGIQLGPLFVHFYGLMYVVGIALAIYIARRRWKAVGGDPALIDEVALWAVPAGIVGGRIYFDITTPAEIPDHWWGIFAVWEGGLGIWGGVALATVVGLWRAHRRGARLGPLMDACAPAIIVAQAIGRIGNYFNQELFGGPTTLPWALHVDEQFRPPGYSQYATFHPTFAYELVFDLAWAAVLVWLGHHRKVRPPGLFALYVAGYSAFRVFEESLRVDYSQRFLGLRLNMYVAVVLALGAIVWFVWTQRREPAGAGLPVQAGAGADAPAPTTTDASTTATSGDSQGDSDELGDSADESEATSESEDDSDEPVAGATSAPGEDHGGPAGRE